MDITSRRNLWEILKKITEKRIIILTTHYMEEASVLGNRIGIIAEGNMKCIGSPLFLIERFGKFMSINIYKKPDADDQLIIDYFKSKCENVEYEKLSQEILFRLPKPTKEEESKDQGTKLEFKTLFQDLDSKIDELKIKNYSASMPTLEDVFLNVAVMKKEENNSDNKNENDKFNSNEEENDKILFLEKYEANYTPFQKIISDLGILFYKRIKLVYRDIKTFFFEIICPILLVIVGCLVVQIDIFKETYPSKPDLNVFGKQTLYYGTHSSIEKSNLQPLYNNNDFYNVTIKELTFSNSGTKEDVIHNFIEEIYNKEKNENVNNFGSLLFTKFDKNNAQYEGYEILNARGRQAPAFYTPFFLKEILKIHNIEFDYIHYPLPMTEDIKGYGKSLNNFCLVFFVVISFALIPANFIAAIVKERVNNSKHLMRISGVSLLSYWFVNYFFELIKYLVTGGICMLILKLFDFVPRYLYGLYLLYGPSMISFTYLFSYIFNSEAIAQNAIILFNLVLGALASTVVIMLRSLDETSNGVKPAAWILRIIPTFAFGFGYNQLLCGKLILFIDHGLAYRTMEADKFLELIYAGGDMLYLGVTSVVYMLILSIIEIKSYSFPKCDEGKLPCDSITDENVLKEIEKANDSTINDSKTEKEENKNKKQNDVIYKKEEEVSNKSEEVSKEYNISTQNKNSDRLKMKENEGINTKSNEQIENVKNEEIDNQNSNENILEVKNTEKTIKKGYSVRLKNIRKIFKGNCCEGGNKVAIKNLSFCIEYGECFGLLGLNGAGKTTTFKCITQEQSPTNGSIYIDGKNLSTNFDEVKSMFGYCPQFDAIFEYMTVFENLKFYSRIKGVDPNKTDKLIKAMLESMTLSNYKDKIAGRLSGGNKRKLSVAISMICNPPIILLDEPSTGMDPEARRFMWAVIHKISTKREKSCVIMTTHAMDEAETLCRRMGIMVNGEFVCLGNSNEIKEKYGYGYEIDVRIKPLSQDMIQKIYNSLGVDKHNKVTLNTVNEYLEKMGKGNLIKHLNKDSIGRKLYLEMEITDSINFFSLISWIHYIENCTKMIKNVLDNFEEVILTEFIENNFLFKVKKSETKSKTIGFLFALLEETKEECNITEYSIQQTSLEQIFNQFAKNQGKTEKEIEIEEKKFEINITAEFIDSILNSVTK